MNWSDERYVRIYTRDTADWNALPWESRALFANLLRKADRSGLVEVSRDRRIRKLAALVMLPDEVVGPGIKGLLEDTVLSESDRGFLFRNFIHAQEAAASDKKRSKDKRERRLAAELAVAYPSPPSAGDTFRGEVTRPLLSADAGVGFEVAGFLPDDTKRVTSTQNVSSAPRNVAKRHDVTHGATPYRTVPSIRDRGADESTSGEVGSDVAGGEKQVSKQVSKFVSSESAKFEQVTREASPTASRKAPAAPLAAKAARAKGEGKGSALIAFWGHLLRHEKAVRPSVMPKSAAAGFERMLEAHPLDVHRRAAVWFLNDPSVEKPFAGSYFKAWPSACATWLAKQEAAAPCGRCGDADEETHELFDRLVCGNCDGLFGKYVETHEGEPAELFEEWWPSGFAGPRIGVAELFPPVRQNGAKRPVDVNAMRKRKAKG